MQPKKSLKTPCLKSRRWGTSKEGRIDLRCNNAYSIVNVENGSTPWFVLSANKKTFVCAFISLTAVCFEIV